VILEELTVVTNYDAYVFESLNKNECGEAVCLDGGVTGIGQKL
jgi:hypothetical protein